MPEQNQRFQPISTQNVDVDTNFAENSFKASTTKSGVTSIIEVKSRSQGIVLDVEFNFLTKVVVKLIASNLPDRVLYSLSGLQLRQIIAEKYSPIADFNSSLAVIPFAVSGYLDLSDDAYIEITITGEDDSIIKYDRIIPITRALNPILVKNFANEQEFDSAQYDEMFFSGKITDVRFNQNGQGVYLPQALYRNAAAKNGFASQKLLPETTYSLSESTSFFLVEF